jgi:hypothetical protein
MINCTGARLRKHVAVLLILLGLALSVVAAIAPAGDAAASERKPTVSGLISAAVRISPPLARLEAGLRMVPRGSVLTGEGRLRPAADLGSWARSRGYRSVSPELGDALAEGSAPDATTRDCTRCYERGNGAAVICPDGYVEIN